MFSLVNTQLIKWKIYKVFQLEDVLKRSWQAQAINWLVFVKFKVGVQIIYKWLPNNIQTILFYIGWCPVETQTNNNLIQNIEHFSIFLKNDIQFKKFNVKR